MSEQGEGTGDESSGAANSRSGNAAGANNSTGSSDVGAKTYSEADFAAQRDRARNFEGKLADMEQRYGDIDPEQYRKDREELEALKRKQMGKPEEEFESWKQSESERLEGIYKEKFENLSTENKKLYMDNKTLRVTNVVMKQIRDEGFSESFCELYGEARVNKYCDLKDGKIVILDSEGNVRRSPEKPAEDMSVDELVKELKTKHPDAILSKAKAGHRFDAQERGTTRTRSQDDTGPTVEDYRSMTAEEKRTLKPSELARLAKESHRQRKAESSNR
jgi:hypothetical protein